MMDIILTLISLFIFFIIIINIKNITTLFLEFINKINYKLINYFQTNDEVEFGSIIYDSRGRFLEFLIVNKQLLPHRVALRSIHRKLMSNKDFLNFGSKKVIMLFSKLDTGSTITFHPNVFITNSTSFNEYYNSIEKYIQVTYDSTTLYGNIDQISEFKLLV
jgi:hypothetical protein